MDKENPTLKISEVIKQLEDFKAEVGDVEVFITNPQEECFDGLGTIFVIMEAEKKIKNVCLLRNSAVLKVK